MRCLVTAHDTQEGGPVPPKGLHSGRKTARLSYFARGSSDTHENGIEINRRLREYGREKILSEVKLTFSALRDVIEGDNVEPNRFRSTVYPTPTSNAQKSPFYAVFMAFFDLIIKDGMQPGDGQDIMRCLGSLVEKISVGQKQTKAEDRVTNVNLVKGLIRDKFVKSDQRAFTHGPGMILDFENAITRSRTETSRYEFKQGFLRLDEERTIDEGIFENIVKTICAIANVGPDSDGYLYIGIADDVQDAQRIRELDNIEPRVIKNVYVVGVEREAVVLNKSLDSYQRVLEDKIRKSELSEPLKTMVTTSTDSITYKSLEVIRVVIPKQSAVIFVGQEAYLRVGSATHKATGPEIAAVSGKF